MNATKAAGGGLIVAAVLGWAWLGYQQLGVARLREREVRLAERLRPAPANPGRVADPPPVEPGPVPTKVPLTAEERLELMRLRSQVTDLRERQRKQAGLSNELAKLQARLAAVTNLASGRLPAGWVRRQDARQAGFATPKAAFESFLWALEHRDTNVLRQAISPNAWEGIQRQIESGDDGFWREAGAIPGFLLRSAETQPNGRVKLDMEIAPGMTGPPLEAGFHEGSWRLEL